MPVNADRVADSETPEQKPLVFEEQTQRGKINDQSMNQKCFSIGLKSVFRRYLIELSN